jgi:hypothetical protein
VSGSWDDEGRQDSGGGSRQISRQWLIAAAGGFVVVAIIAAAGVASLWDSKPDVPEHSAEPPPPREYGGPLWFTVGGADETQLVTNTNPRNATDGPGTPYTGVARYLTTEKCFTDGTNLLVWPRGSRPLTGDRPGVSPAEGLELFDGDTFSANSEQVTIAETEDFPETPPACAPGGHALSLSVVHKN